MPAEEERGGAAAATSKSLRLLGGGIRHLLVPHLSLPFRRRLGRTRQLTTSVPAACRTHTHAALSLPDKDTRVVVCPGPPRLAFPAFPAQTDPWRAAASRSRRISRPLALLRRRHAGRTLTTPRSASRWGQQLSSHRSSPAVGSLFFQPHLREIQGADLHWKRAPKIVEVVVAARLLRLCVSATLKEDSQSCFGC